MPGKGSGLKQACNALLMIEKPMEDMIVFGLKDFAFRQPVEVVPELFYSRQTGSWEIELIQKGTLPERIKPGQVVMIGQRRITLQTRESVATDIESENLSQAENADFFLQHDPSHSLLLARAAFKNHDTQRLIWHCGRALSQEKGSLNPSDYLFLLGRTQDGSLPLEYWNPIFNSATQAWPDHPSLQLYQRQVLLKQKALGHLSAINKISHVTALHEDQLICLHHPPFRLYFPAAFALESVEILRNTLFRVKKQLREYVSCPDQFEVVLCEFPPENQQVQGLAEGGKLFLNLTLTGDINRFRNTIKHEYIHVLNHFFCQQPTIRLLPRWLDEGLAYVLAGHVLEPVTSEEKVSYEEMEEILESSVSNSRRKQAIDAACRRVKELMAKSGQRSEISAARIVLELNTPVLG